MNKEEILDQIEKTDDPVRIVTDIKKLKTVSTDVDNLEDGEKISYLLMHQMLKEPAYGLSAIQIGIPKNVFVINVREALTFINPKIVEASAEVLPFVEGCLSIPGKTFKTLRKINLKIKADNFEGVKYFGISESETPKTEEEIKDFQERFLECVAIQHEYDHLLGLTLHDRSIVTAPYTRENPKYGRNEIITITNQLTGESMTGKYKKLSPFLDSDQNWKIKTEGENEDTTN